ncbi:NAD(P)-dependent oxidoreductase [Aestuariivirga sp.]|uniref:NAD(P)-dependent oxidoreductase n=1 Tax=Aestuariivirga sp. TaxID=2650926 RepID=UPI003593243F
MAKPAIGFIGLGLMGSAMVERLQSLGYQVTIVANRSRQRIDAAVARGAIEVKTAREVAAASDIVMLCMDTSASVESRMYGPDGVIAGVRAGAVVIDFGTSLPASTRAIGEVLGNAGATYLDAPLGRTPTHALQGKLNIMCAGDEAAFAKVKPVLQDLGENVFHLGALGSGHTIKLINNFFGMTVANAMCEAFAMADKTGVDRQKLYDVMSAGPLHSGMMDFVKAYAVDGKPDMLAFSIRNARKDVGYYAGMAESAGAESLMSSPARQALGLALAHGYGDRMVSEMVDFFADLFNDGKRGPSQG